MGFGFGVLRISPDAFCRMTPRELAAAMEAVLGPRVASLTKRHSQRCAHAIQIDFAR